MASHHNPSQNIVALERTPETSPQNVTTAILADFKSNDGNDINLISINNGRKQSTPVSQDVNDGMILINHTGDLVVHERLGVQNKRRNDNANPITEMQGINIIVIYQNPHGNTNNLICIFSVANISNIFSYNQICAARKENLQRALTMSMTLLQRMRNII